MATNNSNNNIANAVTGETFVHSGWNGQTPANIAADTVKCNFFDLASEILVTKLAVEVVTLAASQTVGVAIYSADGGTLLLESGALDSSTAGVKTVTLGAPVRLVPGTYIFAYTGTSSTNTLRGINMTANSQNLINGVTVRNGTAANASASSIFPSTTGVITGAAIIPPACLLSAE